VSGTVVTALRLKTRFFVRVIFMRDLHWGSGQLSGLFALGKTNKVDVHHRQIDDYSRNYSIGGHPVVRVRRPLFCSKEWQQGA